jgi:hypothetical protein
MARRSEFRVLPPRKSAPATKRGRKLPPPSFEVSHKVFGDGLLTGLHLSESGVYLADVDFNGIKHTLRVEQSYFITPVGEIIALASHFPPPAPPKKAKAKTVAADLDHSDEDGEVGEDEPEAA